MSAITQFNQICPVCGRQLKVAVELLGQQVACQHCCGHFIARDQLRFRHPSYSNSSPLERADRLLAASMKSKPNVKKVKEGSKTDISQVVAELLRMRATTGS